MVVQRLHAAQGHVLIEDGARVVVYIARKNHVADGVKGQGCPHATGSREYVAVETGELTVTLDGTDHLLATGDALYYAGDCTHAFANAGEVACVYYTAIERAENQLKTRGLL